MIKLLEREARHVEIRSDSEYVVQGVRNFECWRLRGWRGSNKDLWAQLARLLEPRGPEAVFITKVKGHATDADVASGRVQAADKAGNDGADRLAVDAALQQQAPAELIAAAMHRKAQAIATHRMVIEILEARAAVDIEIAQQLREQELYDTLLEEDDLEPNFLIQAIGDPG